MWGRKKKGKKQREGERRREGKKKVRERGGIDFQLINYLNFYLKKLGDGEENKLYQTEKNKNDRITKKQRNLKVGYRGK